MCHFCFSYLNNWIGMLQNVQIQLLPVLHSVLFSHLLWAVSDHLPVSMEMKSNFTSPNRGCQYFCFKAMWVQGTCEVIRSYWRIRVLGHVGVNQARKVATCFVGLKCQSHSNFGNLDQHKKDILAKLEALSESDGMEDFQCLATLKLNLTKISLCEEIMGHQHSKYLRLKEGTVIPGISILWLLEKKKLILYITYLMLIILFVF